MPTPTPAVDGLTPAGHGGSTEPAGDRDDTRRRDLADLAHDCATLPHRALFALLRIDDVDAAIGCGLIDFVACPDCAAHLPSYEADARHAIVRRAQLLAAWAARDRYLARQARLARRVAERAQRRAAVSTTDGTPAPLPPAAAAALARAKARAATRGTA